MLMPSNFEGHEEGERVDRLRGAAGFIMNSLGAATSTLCTPKHAWLRAVWLSGTNRSRVGTCNRKQVLNIYKLRDPFMYPVRSQYNSCERSSGARFLRALKLAEQFNTPWKPSRQKGSWLGVYPHLPNVHNNHDQGNGALTQQLGRKYRLLYSNGNLKIGYPIY